MQKKGRSWSQTPIHLHRKGGSWDWTAMIGFPLRRKGMGLGGRVASRKNNILKKNDPRLIWQTLRIGKKDAGHNTPDTGKESRGA